MFGMFYSLRKKGKLKLALSNILSANQQGPNLLEANGGISTYKCKLLGETVPWECLKGSNK